MRKDTTPLGENGGKFRFGGAKKVIFDYYF